jgi:uncharacterized protein YukE
MSRLAASVHLSGDPVSNRVLTTDQAVQSITQMKAIIDGGLLDQITALNREGTTLSDPNVWDGRLSEQFRGAWSETSRALETMRQQLMELGLRVEAINRDIMGAGGNA